MKKVIIYLFISIFLTQIQGAIYPQNSNREERFLYASKNLPQNLIALIKENKAEFYNDLNIILNQKNGELLVLVDKKHFLDKNYIPKNLVLLNGLNGRNYYCNRQGLYITAEAEHALQKMATDACKKNLKLVVSSAYRSFEYQANLFEKYAKQFSMKNAKMFSAQAGTSQHQLGTVIDFGSISPEYENTKAGKWLLENAHKYGWSLSYPKDYEHITGYIYECWHYRYIGEDACIFQHKWFGGIQQYMLEFIFYWKEKDKNN